MRKSKGKNIFLYAYVPYDTNSQSMVVSYMMASRAFKVSYLIIYSLIQSVKSLTFARVDCYASRDICSFLKIQQVPDMHLLPNEHTTFDGRSIDIQSGENIDTYLNRYLGTFISLEGGLNSKYGRDDVLDDLAHEFMSEVYVRQYR